MSITYPSAISHPASLPAKPTAAKAAESARATGQTAGSTRAGDSTGSFRELVEESVVDAYKRKHPDHASHVDQQLRAGQAVRDKNGAGVSTQDMTQPSLLPQPKKGLWTDLSSTKYPRIHAS